MEHETLETRLRAGALDAQLTRLYGAEGLEAARSRCASVISGFTKTFESLPEAFFSAPGRTELGATTRTTSTAGSWPPVWTWTSWPPSPPTRAA